MHYQREQRRSGHTPALELAIGEHGAGKRVSARDRGRSQARAQRDGGKVVAHLDGVGDVLVQAVVIMCRAVVGVAAIRGVAEAQLAAIVESCSHRLQDK